MKTVSALSALGLFVVACAGVVGTGWPGHAAGAATRPASSLATAFRRDVLPACRAIMDRYPFYAASQDDIAPAAFMAAFGPTGTVTRFTRQATPAINKAGPGWRWRAPGAVGLPPEVPDDLAKAEQLNQMAQRGISIWLSVDYLPPGAESLTIKLSGIRHVFQAGDTRARPIRWRPDGEPGASLEVQGIGEMRTEWAGAWAFFRMIDSMRRENDGPQSFRASVGDSLGPRLRIMLPEEINPFQVGGMRTFRCPAR